MTRDDARLWRTEKAARMRVIVDADDYFRIARDAMMQARRRIMLIGWDFDARIRLIRDGHEPGEPETVGDFILWLAERNPELEVFLLRWDVGALKTVVRGSTILTVLRWMRHPRIQTKLDAFHPTGASHHQKVVVIDDCFAFCGGIDMTGERWDRRDHEDDDPGRTLPNGKPYKPWHDATAAVEGPVAAALGEMARERWRRAGGTALTAIEERSDCWPEGLDVDFRDIPVGIARTFPEMPDQDGVREIETLFLAQIAAVRTSLYVESQYFASRKIAEASARRLDEADGPEIVIVNPLTAQGWLEPLAMDTARARLMAALAARDRHGRLRLYHPFTEGGAPIYVHAKILIADGRTLRIGSANMNNRSLGLDTECDLVIEAESAADRARVAEIRDDLLAEHLGVEPETVTRAIESHGSLIGAIEALRGDGRSLRPYRDPNLSETERWLADNEVLDPESPQEMFEAQTGRGLFRR
ncbi:phospholipase D-like domain-containing protein, partial [Sphingomonas sp.]|uniref:phospholipase D-like domain-containing protein n=1 Tax=Sphingomonas sp. TaxID=28214 RepID=UPI003B3A68C5